MDTKETRIDIRVELLISTIGIPELIKKSVSDRGSRVGTLARQSTIKRQTWYKAVEGDSAVQLESILEMEKTLGVELFDRVELENELVRQFRAIAGGESND